MWQKINDFFKSIYVQLVKANDSPQRIALGFGVGVFLGIYPGTGPFAALAVAYLLRLNKAATLLGGVLTNTWLSFLTFALSIKIGAAILGLNWEEIQGHIRALMQHFSWKSFFDISFLHIVKPLLIGYAVVGLMAGALSYLIVLYILRKRAKRPR